MLVLTEMRHEAELNLTVVGGEEEASLIGNDRFADKPPALGTDRQVLEVRVGRRETTGSRDRLVIGRVDLSVLGDVTRQRRDIGRDQLFEFSIV